MGNVKFWTILFGLGVALEAAFAAEAPRKVGIEELEKALTLYKSIEHLEVDFKQTKTLKDMDLKLNSEGHLTVNHPNKVEWKILKPTPLTVELEKGTITINSASGTQKFSQAENPSAKDRESFQTLLSWLRLDAREISEKYDVTKLALHNYRFEAKDPNTPVMKALEMKVAATGHVTDLKFEEASGDSVEIQFSKPKVKYRGKR